MLERGKGPAGGRAYGSGWNDKEEIISELR